MRERWKRGLVVENKMLLLPGRVMSLVHVKSVDIETHTIDIGQAPQWAVDSGKDAIMAVYSSSNVGDPVLVYDNGENIVFEGFDKDEFEDFKLKFDVLEDYDGMPFIDALKFVELGFKIKSLDWDSSSFVGMNQYGNIVHVHSKGESPLNLDKRYLSINNWVVVYE